MKKMLQLVITGGLLLATFDAFARPATEAERAQIDARMQAFLVAMENGRYDEVAEISIAPRVWVSLSKTMGMEIAQLEPAIASQMGSIMGQFEMSNISYDLSAIDLTDSESVVYGYFPNAFDVTVGEEKTHIANPVFALRDQGQWYILRIDPQQLPVLQSAYPELSGLIAPKTIVTTYKE